LARVREYRDSTLDISYPLRRAPPAFTGATLTVDGGMSI